MTATAREQTPFNGVGRSIERRPWIKDRTQSIDERLLEWRGTGDPTPKRQRLDHINRGQNQVAAVVRIMIQPSLSAARTKPASNSPAESLRS